VPKKKKERGTRKSSIGPSGSAASSGGKCPKHVGAALVQPVQGLASVLIITIMYPVRPTFRMDGRTRRRGPQGATLHNGLLSESESRGFSFARF
jgi:hypothetical protein